MKTVEQSKSGPVAYSPRRQSRWVQCLNYRGPGGRPGTLICLRCREKVGLKGAGFRPSSLVRMSSVFSAYILI